MRVPLLMIQFCALLDDVFYSHCSARALTKVGKRKRFLLHRSKRLSNYAIARFFLCHCANGERERESGAFLHWEDGRFVKGIYSLRLPRRLISKRPTHTEREAPNTKRIHRELRTLAADQFRLIKRALILHTKSSAHSHMESGYKKALTCINALVWDKNSHWLGRALWGLI